MKTILLIIAIFVIVISCKPNNEECNWRLKVTYLNGDMDTIFYKRTKPRTADLMLLIRFPEGGIVNNSNIPCLYSRQTSGVLCYEIIACGVRKYEILNFEIRKK